VSEHHDGNHSCEQQQHRQDPKLHLTSILHHHYSIVLGSSSFLAYGLGQSIEVEQVGQVLGQDERAAIA
jgi:hypothetical protein